MKTSTFLFTILPAVFILSCSAPRHSSATYNEYPAHESFSSNQYSTDELKKETSSERKIIFSAYIELKVENSEETNLQLEKIVAKRKGYISELGTHRTVIRVANKILDSTILDISSLGKVLEKNRIRKDVTNQYLDYQIRLDNAEKSRKRYLELLDIATTVEAAIKVEKELERLNQTIDLIKGNQNRVNHLSDYSTITIEIKEKKKPGILGYVGIAVYRSVKWLFIRN